MTLRLPLSLRAHTVAIVGMLALTRCYGGFDAEPVDSSSPDDAADDPEPPAGGDDADDPNRPADPQPAACGEAGSDPGPVVFRRLSQDEYVDTVTELLGPEADLGAFINPADGGGFRSVSTALTDVAELSGYSDTAMALAERAIESSMAGDGPFEELATTEQQGDAENVRRFIDRFGGLALRRPLSSTDIERYFEVYAQGTEQYGPRQGVQWMLHAMLSSPSFIYHIERGDPAAANERGLVPLTAYERASRLSYFLTGTMPDAELRDAAAHGGLTDREDVAAQARRILATPRGRRRIQSFFLQWLELESLDPNIPERAAAFDPASPTIREELEQSVRRMIDFVVWESEGSLGDLLETPTFFANDSLAASWGLPGEFSASMQGVEIPDEQRAGLLTHPAVLAIHASSGFASATLRGTFINRHVLCRDIAEPNPETVQQFPEFDEPLETDRATLEQLHQDNPACAACHALLDPPGFAFEHYDQGGRFRLVQDERGQDPPASIDASGEIELDGRVYAFDDARGLAAALAESAEVQACIGRHIFRFGFGREETPRDACSIEEYLAPLADTSPTISELFVALTTTDAFLFLGQPED